MSSIDASQINFNSSEVKRAGAWYFGVIIIVAVLFAIFLPLLLYQSGIPSCVATYGPCSTSGGNLGELITEIIVVIGFIIGVYLFASYGRLYKILEQLGNDLPSDPNVASAIGILDPKLRSILPNASSAAYNSIGYQ